MVRCGKCRFSYLLKNELWCDYISDYVREDSSCEHGEFPEDYDEPLTNADHIRAMTDEELSEFLAEERTAPSCIGKCHKDYEIYGELRTFCSDCWLEWLKEEVKEVEEVKDCD